MKSLINILNEIGEQNVDWSMVLDGMYSMENGIRNTDSIKELIERFPKYKFSGKAYRITETSDTHEIYINANTSWSKTLPSLKWYINASAEVSDDWKGYIISGNISGIDLEQIAMDHGVGHHDDFISSQEVVTITRARNIQYLYRVEKDTLIKV